jgi:AraC-like DNA-binding protein
VTETACHNVSMPDGAHDHAPHGQTYQERRPAAALTGLVTSVWVQRVAPDAPPYSHRTIPNGSVELLCRVGTVPKVVGPQTSPVVEVLEPGSTVVGVRFAPGAAPSLLGVPASELVDVAVEPEELWGRSAGALGERVATSASPREAAAVLEAQIRGRLADAADPDPIVTEAVRQLMPGGTDDVTSLTSSLYISERQLRRRCDAALGLAPKVLHRMLRFQGFLALAQFAMAQGRKPSDDGLALLAAQAGYADQSHLTRECARLAGVSPRALLREAEEWCAPTHDHAASFAPLLRSRARRPGLAPS